MNPQKKVDQEKPISIHKLPVSKKALKGDRNGPENLLKTSDTICQDKNKWASKESLIVLSLILIIIFVFNEFIFNSVWTISTIAFQALSGITSILFLITIFAGVWFFVIDRKKIWNLEREGLILFTIGSFITIILPLAGVFSQQSPDSFFGNNIYLLGVGTVLIIFGAIIVAWFGGFYTIWFFGLIHFIFMSFHEGFLFVIYTHHYGPYDQYFKLLGIFLVVLSVVLFVYHELKFLYLGKLIKRANDLRSQGKYNKAIKFLKTALRLYPRYATAWNNRGNVLFNLGRYDEAIKCYDKALELAPDFQIAKKNKALAVFKIHS